MAVGEATEPSTTTLRVELQQPVGSRQLAPFIVRVTPPSSHAELLALLRDHISRELRSQHPDPASLDFEASNMEIAVEVYDTRQQQFVSLQSVDRLAQLRRARLSVAVLNAATLFPSPDRLALPSRLFEVDPTSGGGFLIDGRRVFIGEVGNSGKGTGLTTWDGSVVLAKYLEVHSRAWVENRRVVELGAGTGLVGLSVALLGAREVVLTDLPYTMDNLAHNAAKTLELAGDTTCAVTTQVLDWFDPPTDLGSIDLILASDVVWVEELIPPLVDTMSVLLTHSAAPTQVLMAHQTRSIKSDELLFSELDRHGLVVERVPSESLHPGFVSDRIFLLSIRQR